MNNKAVAIVLICIVIASAVTGVLLPSKEEKPEATYCPCRDYQFELQMDTVKIYDGKRLVGSYISTWDNQMDSILMRDNE